ncbi:MAG: hypothetical protein HY866_02655 [Chloroflexi bacterium]|nr:hypothetical protein [Chloroflexota bacterium]
MSGRRKPWRSRQRAAAAPVQPQESVPQPDSLIDDVGYNPERNQYLFWLTEEGYLVAQDITCQHEYVQRATCPHCGGKLKLMAHLNRAGQGLSEMVTICLGCRQRVIFIFDISNEVYQTWWAKQLGDLYVRQYDGPTRQPQEPG